MESSKKKSKKKKKKEEPEDISQETQNLKKKEMKLNKKLMKQKDLANGVVVFRDEIIEDFDSSPVKKKSKLNLIYLDRHYCQISYTICIKITNYV